MQRIIDFTEAAKRHSDGKDTVMLIPTNSSEGIVYVPTSFSKYMENTSKALFIVDDNIDQ